MFKRGEAPLFYIISPPLSREGDKGGGLPNKELSCASNYGRDIISPTEVLRQESFKG